VKWGSRNSVLKINVLYDLFSFRKTVHMWIKLIFMCVVKVKIGHRKVEKYSVAINVWIWCVHFPLALITDVSRKFRHGIVTSFLTHWKTGKTVMPMVGKHFSQQIWKVIATKYYFLPQVFSTCLPCSWHQK
jgi:hypothetical protein